MMDHDELLDVIRRSWDKEMRFFSNAGKEERECWVVGEFLRNLSVSFSEQELISFEQHSKTDVGFREARFQIKEIMNKGSRRGAEIKALWQQAKTASRVEEIVGAGLVYDNPPPIRGYELICDRARTLATSGKYDLDTRQSLDLLFYVTRTNASPIQSTEIKRDEFISLGWRSVSCLIGSESLVLFTQDDAPELLRLHQFGS